MLRNLNTLSGGRRTLGTPYVGLLSSQIAVETASGDSGVGALYNESVDPANAGKRLRMRVSPWPSTGSLFVDENGAFTWEGLPDGDHSADYEVFSDGVSLGLSSFSVSVGAVGAVATGATLTGIASVVAGVAGGTADATAPGEILTGGCTLQPGSASGQVGATAPGAEVEGTCNFYPGAATASNHGQAPGADLTGLASLATGSAGGQQNSTATGVELTSSALLNGGVASGTTFSGSLSQADIDAIAGAVLALLLSNHIPVDMQKTNGVEIIGDGTEGNKFRSVHVG